MKNLNAQGGKKNSSNGNKNTGNSSTSPIQYRIMYRKAMAALSAANQSEIVAFKAATDRVLQKMK